MHGLDEAQGPSHLTHCPLKPVYCGIEIQPSGECPEFCIYIHDGFYAVDCFTQIVCPQTPLPLVDRTVMNAMLLEQIESTVMDWLKKYLSRNNYKLACAGIGVEAGDTIDDDPCGKVYIRKCRNVGRLKLPSRLWFELDCVPIIVHTSGTSIDERACQAVRKSLTHLHSSSIANLVRTDVGYRHRVEVDANFRIHMIDIEQYEGAVSNETWAKLVAVAEEFRTSKLKFCFYSSTPQGGGVALMRHSLMRLLHQLGVEASWYVMKPKPGVFDITKRKFHNVLQGVEAPGTSLTGEDIETYERWSEDNARSYWQSTTFKEMDVIVIDDPQPAGLIPHIKRANPNCKIIYRSHIELRSDLIDIQGTEQYKVWHYLFDSFIKHADVFIAHPVLSFVPSNVNRDNLLLMPATTDTLDGLNKPLSDRDIEDYLKIFNRVSFDQTGKRLDFQNRPYIVQICRFDPSKGIPDVIKAYSMFRDEIHKHLPVCDIPQLVVTGHGSIDDPDGAVVFEQISRMLKQGEYAQYSSDIIMTRIPPSDQILNALFRHCKVALQLSTREGFEIKVTEAVIKNVPIIAYASGGIPYQIKPGMTGYLVQSGDYESVAVLLVRLMTSPGMYDRIKERSTDAKSGEEYLTIVNCLNWLSVINESHKGTVHGSIERILAEEKNRDIKYNCTDQDDICTVQNAMTGVEISESISGMTLASKLAVWPVDR